MTYDAFVSYASPDLAVAEIIQRRLGSAGLKVWFDKARLNPGCDWHREIESGCESSRVLLPILTPNWKKSAWTKFETYGAENVIPIVVKGELRDILTPPLSKFQTLDIDVNRSDGSAWERLFNAVRSLVLQPPPDKVQRLCDVGYIANRYFVGREQELIHIHERLHRNPTPELTQSPALALTALGGVGKTTLVRHYIEKMWRCYPQVCWVDARLGMELEFARLCDLMNLARTESTRVDEKAQLALQEVGNRVERLLVIDNAENEESIQNWLPKAGGCRTLITSRFTDWSPAIEMFDLQVLERQSALDMLVARSGAGSFESLSKDDQAACEMLAQKLGFLPLALEQAAAYISQQGHGFTFTDYWRLYQGAASELLAAGSLGSTRYPDSVMTTWTATASKLAPASRSVLRICSFLAPAPLPISALTNGITEILDDANRAIGVQCLTPAQTEVWVRDQVQQLRDYSMIQRHGNSVAVHPLVQEVERINLERDEKAYLETFARSLRLVEHSFGEDASIAQNWPTLDPMAPHAMAVTQHGEQSGLGVSVVDLRRRIGHWFRSKNNIAEAETQLRRVLESDRANLGQCHTRVASDLNELSIILCDANRNEEAESLLLEAIEIEESSTSPNYSKLATFHFNLADPLIGQKRADEAERVLLRAREIATNSYGREHPMVQRVAIKLGALFAKIDRPDKARKHLNEGDDDCEVPRDSSDPIVADKLNCKALGLFLDNKTVDAEKLFELPLSILERGRSANERVHELTPVVRSNLALLYAATNRRWSAITMIRRAREEMRAFEREAGTTHKNRSDVMHNFSHICWDSFLHYSLYVAVVFSCFFGGMALVRWFRGWH